MGSEMCIRDRLHGHLDPRRLGDHLLPVEPGEGGLGLPGQAALEDDLGSLVRLANDLRRWLGWKRMDRHVQTCLDMSRQAHRSLGEGGLHPSSGYGSFIA